MQRPNHSVWLYDAFSAHVKASSGSNTVATGNLFLADTAASLPVSTLPISSAGTAAFSNDTIHSTLYRLERMV